jgi:hypothetical protein
MQKQNRLLQEKCGTLKPKEITTAQCVETNYSDPIKSLLAVVDGLVFLNKKTSRVSFLKMTTPMACSELKHFAEDVTVILDTYLTTVQHPPENGIA